MGKIWMPGGGGSGAGSDDCTATKDKVLSGYTAVTKDSDDEPVAGTMENLTVKTNIQHDSNNGTKVIKADGAFLGNNTDGVRRLSLRYNGNAGYITPNTLFGLPAQTKTVASSTSNQTITADSGKVLESVTVSGMPHRGGLAKAESQWFGNGNVYFGITAGAYTSAAPGDNKPQVYRTAAELGIEQWKIRGDASICGIAGDGWTVWTGATATAAQILSGQTAWVNGSKLTGTMTNRGAVSQALPINGSYTIPAGYHNGSGKVTQSIATMGGQTITPSAAQQTVSCSGKYMTGNIIVNGFGSDVYKQTVFPFEMKRFGTGEYVLCKIGELTANDVVVILISIWGHKANDMALYGLEERSIIFSEAKSCIFRKDTNRIEFLYQSPNVVLKIGDLSGGFVGYSIGGYGSGKYKIRVFKEL